jgi:exonuclease III
MPSGLGMVATFNGVKIANIYAPGARKRKEREDFYNIDFPQVLDHPPSTLLLVGDFNCVQHAQDCTGSPNISRALKSLLTGLELFDTWDQRNENRRYMHYTATRASRVDRIYATRNMMDKKQSTEICAVAFSDHLAVILHTKCLTTTTTWGRGLWKMNVSMLQNEPKRTLFEDEWGGGR